MIYLTTGGNGAGKTLFTLFDVRATQLRENRPVYFHGFEPLQAIHDFGWLPFEPEKWQDLPDGSICIFDECQNEFPAKIVGIVPDYINAIAQFRRKRGFDFYLVCPHPSLIHVNVRRLIETPSWHRHMKRPAAGDMCSELRWSTVNTNCEKPGASSTGQLRMRAYPKEVYSWYKSATLHTVKRAIPRQFWVLLVCIVLIPLVAWYAWRSVHSLTEKAVPETASGSVSGSGLVAQHDAAIRSPADYVADYAPRIEGLPYTAPRYDDVSKPITAPYPAACVHMGSRCDCYTQQGTRLPTPAELCLQIVSNGFFVDWSTSPSSQAQSVDVSRPSAQPIQSLVSSQSVGGALPLSSSLDVVGDGKRLKDAAARGAVLAELRAARPVSSY